MLVSDLHMPTERRIYIIGTRISTYPRNTVFVRSCEALGDVHTFEIVPSLGAQWKVLTTLMRDARRADTLIVLYPIERLWLVLVCARLIFPGIVVGDALISAYDTWVNDRALASRWGLKAIYYSMLDQIACWCSDVLLFDTRANEQYFLNRYFVRRRTRSIVNPISIDIAESDAISAAFPRGISEVPDRFTVLFLGNYIPLQGVTYILRAIALIPERERFRFLMIGNGQTRKEALALRDELGLTDVEFIERIPHNEAVGVMKKADIALGVFGDTEKATRVIPNKVLEAMACRTIVITGKSPAMESYFSGDKEVYYAQMAAPRDIARTIARAYAERDHHVAMRDSARAVIEREFSISAQTKRLSAIIPGT